MRNILKNLLLTSTLFSIATIAFGQTIQQPHLPTYACPSLNQIHKSTTNYWFSEDRLFRNYDTSAANKLVRFLGAQWSGAVLGNVSCVYLPENKDVFIVTLHFSKLAFHPTTGKWQDKIKGSISNCYSTDVNDCRFTTRPKPVKTDIYKVAEQLRQEASPYDNPGF